MTTLALKSYQQAALDALAGFARAAQVKGPALAFVELVGRPYNPDPFGAVPCVCLRIPTGGGKTLLAAHAVATLAREWCANPTLSSGTTTPNKINNIEEIFGAYGTTFV